MNKRVCILTSVHFALDARIFYKEAKSLSRAGYDVTLIAPNKKNEVIDRIKVVALSQSRNRFFRFFWTIWKLLYLAKKQNSDIYHFHDPELIFVGSLLKFFTKAKVIYDVHEHYPNVIIDEYRFFPVFIRHLMSKLFIFIENFFVPSLDFVIYTTPIVGCRYRKMNILSERIENYPMLQLSNNPVELSRQKYIIYLGGMAKIRGILELLEAFGDVVKKYPDWKLCLLGNINSKLFIDEINNLILKLKIKENVELISHVSYLNKEKYSSKSSIGVVTYLPFANNISCLPNKIFDYMLVGLPVVASNFLLWKEIIENSRCGLTVNPQDPKDIAAALEYLICNSVEARRMGENGRKAVQEKYNWEQESGKLIKVYEKLCVE